MKHLSEYIGEAIGKTVFYDAEKDIPTADLENIIKEIAKQGFGAAGPAMTSSNLYRWIAEKWAKHENNPSPHLARLKCTYEKRNHMSVYSVPHCNPVDKILYKYFNSYGHGDEDYWYKKSTPLKQVLKWLGDDMRGTMENPDY